MPGSVCGTWPAFWMVGTDPPTAGEIDIIEGVNEGPNNEVTLHTNEDGCSIRRSGFSGKIATENCYIYSTGSAGSGGCGIVDNEANSYGDAFNAAGGGVFATEWTSDFIKVWRFSSSNIPNDIRAGNPDPSRWGPPVASFSGSCDIDSRFQNLHIVFDVAFCGSWAGSVWSQSNKCAPLARTCVDYVRGTPAAFSESYWGINTLKVYQRD
ncbi:endo-1-3(4)-beta-glucanase [Penicillium angulare]|uniref:endo-1-3(4)-beta-glucanase n=1 Tax=Penicillium angulare TaxID=116970 RepID=UPI0025423077|nr:endo-1-3(4)-beta-glucanase [Penicillium angulare]KAJ5261384.1 endo-1-3(4)-beta-glucanase [Penicillium angulare]